jgi:hypothetical protein
MAYAHTQAGVIETISHDLDKEVHDEHSYIFGIPEDIALVLAIDAVLIALRLSNVLVPSSFIGAKVVGTSILIGTHLFG